MNKKDFLDALRRELRTLPEAEIEKSVSYYSEIIDDTVENGLTEEQAVTSLGPMDKIVGQIMLDAPINALVMSKINQRREQREAVQTPEQPEKKRSRSVLSTILIIIGFPVWFPLLISFGAVVLSLYVVLWSLVICAFAVAASLAAAGILLLFTALFFPGTLPVGILFAIGAALILIGLAFLFFPLAKLCAVGSAKLTAAIARGIKTRIIGGKKK